MISPNLSKWVALLVLWTGADWTEGPVYFGDMHTVIFSDIPNDRLLRYDEVTGHTTLFRKPSNQANGNTRDRQGHWSVANSGHAA